MKQRFEDAAAAWVIPADSTARRPSVEFVVETDYPSMCLQENDIALETVRRAAQRSGRPLTFVIGGGGSDANIFNSHGLQTAILATGMTDVHTTDEKLDLKDMVRLTELLHAIATE
jgi:tripeptide aminopeptidase